jgi:hypothetical protein
MAWMIAVVHIVQQLHAGLVIHPHIKAWNGMLGGNIMGNETRYLGVGGGMQAWAPAAIKWLVSATGDSVLWAEHERLT